MKEQIITLTDSEGRFVDTEDMGGTDCRVLQCIHSAWHAEVPWWDGGEMEENIDIIMWDTKSF